MLMRPGSLAEPARTRLNSALRIIGESVVTPQAYGANADGVTDDAAAINAALKANTDVLLPPGDYALKSAVILEGGRKRLRFCEGARLVAQSGFTDEEVIRVGYADASDRTNFWKIENPSIHGMQNVQKGIHSTRARFGHIDGGLIIGCLAKGIHLGSSATGSNGDVHVTNTRILWWNMDESAPIKNTITDSALTAGIHWDRCADSRCSSVDVIGYRTAFKLSAGACDLHQVHAWTQAANYGPMERGLHITGSLNTISDWYMDTPTTAGGAAGIAEVYGAYITGFGTILTNGRVFNNGDFGGEDNVLTSVYIATPSSQTQIIGIRHTATSSAKKFKAYYGGQFTQTDKVSRIGHQSDGRVYDNSRDSNALSDATWLGNSRLSWRGAVGLTALGSYANDAAAASAGLAIGDVYHNTTVGALKARLS